MLIFGTIDIRYLRSDTDNRYPTSDHISFANCIQFGPWSLRSCFKGPK